MPYTDLLRTTVFITGAEATVLGAISAIAVGGEPSGTTVIVALAWWAIAIIGTGYALIVSLAWHTREAAVQAIEERDGVRFYVVPNSALRPIELVRTPGLRSDRLNAF